MTFQVSQSDSERQARRATGKNVSSKPRRSLVGLADVYGKTKGVGVFLSQDDVSGALEGGGFLFRNYGPVSLGLGVGHSSESTDFFAFLSVEAHGMFGETKEMVFLGGYNSQSGGFVGDIVAQGVGLHTRKGIGGNVVIGIETTYSVHPLDALFQAFEGSATLSYNIAPPTIIGTQSLFSMPIRSSAGSSPEDEESQEDEESTSPASDGKSVPPTQKRP
jgi:hypothetical protein